MSSSNPNLQNIPIRTELGREIRRAFITPPGTVLLSADYSQVELRIMAHISEEPYLIDAFARNYDVHTATAAIVNGIPMEQVTKTQRIFAKRVNFGILYGMGAHRLARESGLPYREAQQFINTYFERLPGVQRYISETEDFVRREGYVQTLMGRKRRFPIFRNAGDGRGNHNAVQRALREAVNMPIQGTAADIMKRAMIQLDTALAERRLSARLLLQVHDELLLEVPERERDETVALVVDIMEAAFDLKAPLRANAQIGSNWLDMEAVR